MRVIGFLRAGDVALVRRKAAAFAVDRSQLEKFAFGDAGRMEIETGDQIPDGADWSFERIVVPIDVQEQLELDRRNSTAVEIEAREIGTAPKTRSKHAWR